MAPPPESRKAGIPFLAAVAASSPLVYLFARGGGGGGGVKKLAGWLAGFLKREIMIYDKVRAYCAYV